MDKNFIAPTPWTAERPKTLVICCSDGRWHAQVEDFLDARAARRADMCVLPGGPAAFSLWGAGFDESRPLEKNFKFLAKHHDLESVWLIAHQGCAYYGTKYPCRDAKQMVDRQLEDLEHARKTLDGWQGGLDIHKVFASLEGNQVKFTVH
jgi:carbonic anhydrase